MIERNDVFVYALKAAPAVLYERFKQYGQVMSNAVFLSILLMSRLAWCFGLVFRIWRNGRRGERFWNCWYVQPTSCVKLGF